MPNLATILATILALLLGPTTHIEGMVGQPQNIHPFLSQENPVDRDLSQLIFCGLTQIDHEGQIQPGIAKSWEVSEDRKVYTFHLDSTATWHDGAPVTATDVTYTAAQSPAFKNVQVEEVDRHTVRVTLKDPFAPLLHLVSIGLLPKHLAGRVLPLVPVGSGPYKITNLERSTRKIETLTLSKVQTDRAGPERITFRFYETAADIAVAARLGELDGLEARNFSWANFSSHKVPLGGRYFSLLFNLREKELLKDQKVRKALAQLTHREEIIEQVGGEGVPIYGALAGNWAQIDVATPKYAETTEAAFTGEIGLTFPDTENHQKTADILKKEWEKTGLEITLVPRKLDQLKGEDLPQRAFDILLMGQEVAADPDRYTLWHSTQTEFPGLNLTGYKNMRADRALEEGRKVSDPEERKEHYANFQEVLAEDIPCIFLYQPTYHYHLKKNAGQLDLSGIVTPEERWPRILALYP